MLTWLIDKIAPPATLEFRIIKERKGGSMMYQPQRKTWRGWKAMYTVDGGKWSHYSEYAEDAIEKASLGSAENVHKTMSFPNPQYLPKPSTVCAQEIGHDPSCDCGTHLL